jgi:indolepyruvate decarboxylase
MTLRWTSRKEQDATMKQSIGDFVLRRLHEAGIQHLFGVPGDYNLEFMQQIAERGDPAWIGTCNELNAAYAADGYARLHGLGAVIITNGVGALSAINGVAGASSEHVPVICICGAPPMRAVEHGDLMHHTLADGGRGNFYRAFTEVTAAQAQLTPQNAANEIDRLILTAWQRKLPVYLELPSDIAYLEIDVPGQSLQLSMPASDKEHLHACTQAILARLQAAKASALLLDLDADRFGVKQQLAALAGAWQMRVATMNTCKGTFPETSPLFAGTYAGVDSTPAARAAVEQSDCLLTVGYRRIEVTTGFFTDHLPASAIHLHAFSTDVAADNYQAVTLPELVQGLLDTSPPSKQAAQPTASVPVTASPRGPLTQKSYWTAMQAFLRPGDVILAEDGTSSFGAGGLKLPSNCTFVCQTVWESIGYATASLLGTMLAAPQRRHLLFSGDGSFQMTAQQLSTILGHDLTPFIFLINNRGYTVERAILGRDAPYNDVANWRYAELPRVFRRDTTAESYVVETSEQLRDVLDAPHTGLVFVEAVMDPDDAPIDMIRVSHEYADSDYGPRGPQSAPNAQIPVPTA